jgi:hypothetical protein
MLEKIAAINHLTVADVVRLFLIEALSEGDRNWKLWELSRQSVRIYLGKQGAVSLGLELPLA